MPEPSASDRPLPGRQREARSNDTAVLAAAREVFSARGHDASMVDIARHAGVGVASIYRRYPTKDALVEALHLHAVRAAAELVAGVVNEFAATAPPSTAPEDGEAADVPASAMQIFLARQITGAAGPLLRPPRARGPVPTELAAASEELRAGLDRLIAHDQSLGLLPAGFTAADAMQLLQHLRPTLPYPRTEADALHLRYLDLVMRGLRDQTRAGVALADGPRWDEWVGAWHD